MNGNKNIEEEQIQLQALYKKNNRKIQLVLLPCINESKDGWQRNSNEDVLMIGKEKHSNGLLRAFVETKCEFCDMAFSCKRQEVQFLVVGRKVYVSSTY